MNVFKLADHIRRFRDAEDGAATIEAVLWMPFFIFFLVLIADTSFVFHNQAQITRVAQDANRALSVGRFNSTAQTQDYIVSALSSVSSSVSANTTVDNGVITTTVLVPVDDLVAVGFFDFLQGYNIRIDAQHLVEY